MAKRPVATVLTVTPSAATSRDERLQEADRGHAVGVGEVEAGDRLAGRAGADVDDPPPAAFLHPGDDGFGEHARGEDERAVGVLPFGEVVAQRAAERRPAGVGDEDLDRAEGGLDLGRQLLEPLEVGGVGDERRGLAVDRPGRLLGALLRAADDGDPRPFARERLRDPQPDPRAGAHDQGDAPLQPEVHARPQCSNSFTPIKYTRRAPVAQWSTVPSRGPKSVGLSSRRSRVRFSSGALGEIPGMPGALPMLEPNAGFALEVRSAAFRAIPGVPEVARSSPPNFRPSPQELVGMSQARRSPPGLHRT